MRISFRRLFDTVKTAIAVNDMAVEQNWYKGSEVVDKVKNVVEMIEVGRNISEVKGDLDRIISEFPKVNPTPAGDLFVKLASSLPIENTEAVKAALLNTVDTPDKTPSVAVEDALTMIMGDEIEGTTESSDSDEEE